MRGLRKCTIAYIKRGSHLITQARPSSNSASILGVWISALGLAILGVLVITGSLKGLPPVALFVTPIAALGMVVLANWRTGTYFFLTWLVVEDLPRKFLGNDMRLYFAKDVLAAILYLAFLAGLVRGRVPRLKARFLGPLLLFIAWGVLQAFNPESPSPVYGLLGLRMYFFYIPLLFVGYALLRDERDLRRFLVFNLVVAVVIAGLGVVQGIVGLDFLNPAELAPELTLAHYERQAPISGTLVPRSTSVFVSDARFAWYLLLMLLLGIGTVAYLLARRQGTRVAVASVGIIAAAIVLSGSRGTFMYAVGSTGVLAGAFLHIVGPRLRKRVGRVVTLGVTAVGLAVVALLAFYPEALGARWSWYYETIAPWSSESELAWRIWGYPVANFLGAFSFPGWPSGYGIGTSSLGVQYVTGLLGLPDPGIAVESGYGTLILELGIIGPLLWLLWTGALVREGWRMVRRLRGTPFFPVGFAILWFAFLLLFPFTFGGMQPYQNFVFNAYLWLLTGILFRLPSLPVIAGSR